MNVRWPWLVMVVAGCKDSPPALAPVGYAVNLTGAPVCPEGKRVYNRLRTTLVVELLEPERQVGSTVHGEHQIGSLIYTGVAEPGPNQVQLSATTTARFRFGVCPIKDDPEGRGAVYIGCERTEARIYSERTAVLDPSKLVRWSLQPFELRASGPLPWPAPELECWEGKATAWPTPL